MGIIQTQKPYFSLQKEHMFSLFSDGSYNVQWPFFRVLNGSQSFNNHIQVLWGHNISLHVQPARFSSMSRDLGGHVSAAV